MITLDVIVGYFIPIVPEQNFISRFDIVRTFAIESLLQVKLYYDGAN
jgi:hypothetical protein